VFNKKGYSDRERIAILENELKRLRETLVKDVNGIKEDQKIILERQEILSKNQVLLKQEIDGKDEDKKETYFG
jgi:hypothetical protein